MLPTLFEGYCKLYELSLEEVEQLYDQFDQWKKSRYSSIDPFIPSDFENINDKINNPEDNWLDLSWEDELVTIQRRLEEWRPNLFSHNFLRVSSDESSPSEYAYKNLRSEIFSTHFYQECLPYYFGEISLQSFAEEFKLTRSSLDPGAFRKRKWPWRFFSSIFCEITGDINHWKDNDPQGVSIFPTDPLNIPGNIPDNIPDNPENSLKNTLLAEDNWFRNARILWELPYPSLLILKLCQINQPRYLTVVEIQSVSEILTRKIQKGKVPTLVDLCINQLPLDELEEELKCYPLALKRRIRFLTS